MLYSHSISLYPNHVVTNRQEIEGRRNTLRTSTMDNCFNFSTNSLAHQVWKAFGKGTTSSPRSELSAEMKSLLLTVNTVSMRKKPGSAQSPFLLPGLDTTVCTGVPRFMAAAQRSWWGKVFGGFHIPPFVLHITDVSLNVLRASPWEA